VLQAVADATTPHQPTAHPPAGHVPALCCRPPQLSAASRPVTALLPCWYSLLPVGQDGAKRSIWATAEVAGVQNSW